MENLGNVNFITKMIRASLALYKPAEFYWQDFSSQHGGVLSSKVLACIELDILATRFPCQVMMTGTIIFQ